MKKPPLAPAAGLVLAALLAACQAPTSQQVGTVGGSAIGAMAGNQFGSGAGRVGATVLGAGVGGMIGGSAGRSLDQRAASSAAEAEFRALEHGQPGVAVAWRSGSSHGQFVPGPRRMIDGRQCRSYMHKLSVNGRIDVAEGTACRLPHGGWRSEP